MSEDLPTLSVTSTRQATSITWPLGTRWKLKADMSVEKLSRESAITPSSAKKIIDRNLPFFTDDLYPTSNARLNETIDGLAWYASLRNLELDSPEAELDLEEEVSGTTLDDLDTVAAFSEKEVKAFETFYRHDSLEP